MKSGIFQIAAVHHADGEKRGEGRKKRQAGRQTHRPGHWFLTPDSWWEEGRWKRRQIWGCLSPPAMTAKCNWRGAWGREARGLGTGLRQWFSMGTTMPPRGQLTITIWRHFFTVITPGWNTNGL